MDSSKQIKKFIQEVLNHSFQDSVLSSRVDTTRVIIERKKESVSWPKVASDHVKNNLEAFNKEMKKLAMEGENPCIRFYLRNALQQFKEDLSKGDYRILGTDELML